MGNVKTKTSTKSAREKIQNELELVCGIKCERLVTRALQSAHVEEVPEEMGQLRTFIYHHLRNALLRHYKDEETANRLCEVVATIMLIETGVFRVPETRGRQFSESHVEIRPPVRMSLPPGSSAGSLADVAIAGGRKRK